jgi:hypothetical protein
MARPLEGNESKRLQEVVWASDVAMSLLEMEAIGSVTQGLCHLVCPQLVKMPAIALVSSSSFDMAVIGNWSTVSLRCRKSLISEPHLSVRYNEAQ